MSNMNGAFAKVARAKVHLGELESSVKAYQELDPHDFTRAVVDHPTDPSLAIVEVRVTITHPQPDDWGLIVGDILTNLRAALDHSLFGHATERAETSGTPLSASEQKKLQYPMVHDAPQWPSKAATLASVLDPAVLAAVEATQPFKSPKPDWHSLAILNRLVNLDKHRTVRVVSYVNEQFKVKPGTEATIVSIDDSPKELCDGGVVASAVVRRPLRRPGQPPTDVAIPFNIELGYAANIDVPKVGKQKGVVMVMGLLVDHVEQTLQNLQAAGC